MAVGSMMVLASLGNVFNRGPAARSLRRQFPRAPRVVTIAWGVFGIVAGGVFIALPFLATPGHLY